MAETHRRSQRRFRCASDTSASGAVASATATAPSTTRTAPSMTARGRRAVAFSTRLLRLLCTVVKQYICTHAGLIVVMIFSPARISA
eukprot:6202268-Pleurochrysis_carterae.AAC.3